MALVRLVLSDLHLVTGIRPGQANPMEDFFHDAAFAELIDYYVAQAADQDTIELILNGDIFDLLKVQIDGRWPTEITDEIAVQKLQACLDGHPGFVAALNRLLASPKHRIVYLPGNHDQEMWMPGPQLLFRRYVGEHEKDPRIRFVTESDTYHLPEGIQIMHGHQFERIHRVDYDDMTATTRDGREILKLPWGSLWILEVLNPIKMTHRHIDLVQPLGRLLLGSLVFDRRLLLRFFYHSAIHFVRHRVFAFRRWWQAIRSLPRLIKDELLELTYGYDERISRALDRVRGVHTVIVGHSHGPRYVQLESGKLMVNTGTWVDMVNLDLAHLGRSSGFTYALIAYDDEGRPETKLLRWLGQRNPYEAVPYLE